MKQLFLYITILLIVTPTYTHFYCRMNLSRNSNAVLNNRIDHLQKISQIAGLDHASRMQHMHSQQKKAQQRQMEQKKSQNELQQQQARTIAQENIKKQEQLQKEQQLQGAILAQAQQLRNKIHDYQQLNKIAQHYGFGSSAYFEKRLQLLQAIQNNQSVYTTYSYTISEAVKQRLRESSIDESAYLLFYGNQLQQAIHQDGIAILEEIE